MARTGSDRDLMAEEEQLWSELHGLIDTLPRDKVEEPGYFAEGWTAKDLIAHIGSWLAEAGAVLEQIRFGTYRPEEIDIDAMNKRFFDSLHDTAYPDVRAQAITARTQPSQDAAAIPATRAPPDSPAVYTRASSTRKRARTSLYIATNASSDGCAGPFRELFDPARMYPCFSAAARKGSIAAAPRANGSKTMITGHFFCVL